jgi:HK97 family phage prohead protease
MIDKTKLEKRNNVIESIEDNTVRGYACVFDSESQDLGGFFEIIKRDAITDETIKTSDVFAVLNHDRSHGIFARSKNGSGSLTITLDDKGLRYEFTLADTPIAHELKSYLERGEIDSSSFAFTVGQDRWTKVTENNKEYYKREILKIDTLFDVSPVFNPAYKDTSVALRALEQERSIDKQMLINAENEQRKKALDAYYLNLKKQIKQ